MRPLLWLKRVVCAVGLGAWLIEFCDCCGARVRDVWWAHPELWTKVTGNEDAGTLCLRCFAEACYAHGFFVRWTPIATHHRDSLGRWFELSPPDPEFFPVAARLHAEARQQ